MAAKALRAHKGSSRDASFHETMVTGGEMQQTEVAQQFEEVWERSGGQLERGFWKRVTSGRSSSLGARRGAAEPR